MDRANGRIFLFSYLLVYFAAPVTYIGVVQAVLATARTERWWQSAVAANRPDSSRRSSCLAGRRTA